MMTMIYKHHIKKTILLMMLVSLSVIADSYDPDFMIADLSLDQAVNQVKLKGQILSAKTRNLDGQRIHVIKILTHDGRVRRYRMDANTGQPYYHQRH